MSDERPGQPSSAPRPEWASPGDGPAIAGPSGSDDPRWTRPGPGPATPQWPVQQTILRPKPPAGPSRRRPPLGALLVGAALLAGFVGGALGTRTRDPAPGARPSPAATSPAVAAAPDLADLYKQVSPSVVQILVEGPQRDGSGSGIILDEQGTVLTNNHVVAAGPAKAILSDGQVRDTTIVGTDPARDIAVLRMANPPEGLVPARLGDSDAVGVGDAVVAIGSPFGLQNSLTAGVVSGIDRTFGGSPEYPPLRGLIQTDAAINPGNSGGPLVTLAGEVIGITTAIESPVRGSVGVGFAVPINTARKSLPALIQGVSLELPFLGIRGQAANGGIEVLEVLPGSSAQVSSLRSGDLILSAGGRRTATMDELSSEIERHAVGEVLDLSVRRGGSELPLHVTLKAWKR
ncbi:MAG: S1C family serine protease [Actinomycetota bacterium]